MKIKQDLYVKNRLIFVILILIFIYLCAIKVKANNLIKSESNVTINSFNYVCKEIDETLMFNEEKGIIIEVPSGLVSRFESKGYYQLKETNKLKEESLDVIIIMFMIVIFIVLGYKLEKCSEYEPGLDIIVLLFNIIALILFIIIIPKLPMLIDFWIRTINIGFKSFSLI